MPRLRGGLRCIRVSGLFSLTNIRDVVFPFFSVSPAPDGIKFDSFEGTGFIIGCRGFALTAGHVARRLRIGSTVAGFVAASTSAASGYVCFVDDAAESFVVGVVVAPDDVPADHAGLLFVAGMVGAVEREVAQCRELRLVG